MVRLDQNFQQQCKTLQSVDKHVGKIQEALRVNSVLDETIIIYASNNGYHFMHHRLREGKGQPYKYDLRVPLIVAGPGVPENTVVQDMITANIDVPTAIHHIVTGGEGPRSSNTPQTLDSISFMPCFNDILAKSTKQEEEEDNKDDDTSAVSPSSHPRREDMLVEYKGMGSYSQCGLYPNRLCRMDLKGDYSDVYDVHNNTYHCL